MHNERDVSDGKDPPNADRFKAARVRHGLETLQHRWTDGWLQEYICIVFGLAFIAALAVILLKQDGKPPPTFGTALGGALTLNTIISIIAAAAKALLLLPVMECVSQLKWMWFLQKRRPLSDFSLFDQACRGLFAGFSLIWKTRLRCVSLLLTHTSANKMKILCFYWSFRCTSWYRYRPFHAATGHLQHGAPFNVKAERSSIILLGGCWVSLVQVSRRKPYRSERIVSRDKQFRQGLFC